MIIPALETSLDRWLRTVLPLPVESGDISFDTPDGTWGAAVSRPTVNLFLHEVARAPEAAEHRPSYVNGEGTRVQPRPEPRIGFGFLVSAWAGGVRDEHLLLGEVLTAVLSHDRLPDEHIVEGLAGPVELRLGDGAVNRVKDVWSGIDGRFRASLLLVATMPVPVTAPEPVAPQVTEVGGAVVRRTADRPAPRPRGTVEERGPVVPRRTDDGVGWTVGT